VTWSCLRQVACSCLLQEHAAIPQTYSAGELHPRRSCAVLWVADVRRHAAVSVHSQSCNCPCPRCGSARLCECAIPVLEQALRLTDASVSADVAKLESQTTATFSTTTWAGALLPPDHQAVGGGHPRGVSASVNACRLHSCVSLCALPAPDAVHPYKAIAVYQDGGVASRGEHLAAA